ncbi:DoxX-like protein [Kribbella amoyensis]|uniref:DoxX-like protein n=1 Tax=Kribbella amoyensis TaxID=996641 RepID=A0A561BJS5_9ACTN|nr:DoxX family protein [Kribbella amoyensis]TWD79113.1 DoxX-like protein [Kribbella amoyensis]
MNLALWIIAGLLAAAFLAGGTVKLIQPKDKLVAAGFGFAEDFDPGTVKAIGAVELLAALGLILPATLGVAPILVPLAAVGVVLLMIGAGITHLRRHEHPPIVANLTILGLAALVAWGRFGPESFG